LLALDEGLGSLLESSSKRSLLDAGGSTFVTGVDTGMQPPKTKIEFNTTDIDKTYFWNAHTDTINWITYT